ncbi:hypothetical protein [Streptomyces sp. NPDC060031]|uniref:hypothetical protein n=1 Tax=Streptomyces sp. NPDC060031 TaxID=3347043 RepID=UPI0036BD03E5
MPPRSVEAGTGTEPQLARGPTDRLGLLGVFEQPEEHDQVVWALSAFQARGQTLGRRQVGASRGVFEPDPERWCLHEGVVLVAVVPQPEPRQAMDGYGTAIVESRLPPEFTGLGPMAPV